MKKTSVLTKLLVSNKGIQDRRTPKEIFDYYNKTYNFQLDPCTSDEFPGNLETPHYFTKEQDGLEQSWAEYGTIYVNPPFRDMKHWIRKCYEESLRGCIVVLLAPVKTDTAWWHEYALKADLIEFIRGRVTFSGHDNPFIIGIAMLIYGHPQKNEWALPNKSMGHAQNLRSDLIRGRSLMSSTTTKSKPRCSVCNSVLYGPSIRKRIELD